MTKKFILAVFAGILSAQVSFADCTEIYNEQKEHTLISRINTAGNGLISGTSLGMLAAVTVDSPSKGLGTGLAVSGTSSTVLTAQHLRAVSLNSVISLFQESEVGAGLYLTKATQALNRDTKSKISSAQVAKTIQSLNAKNALCQNPEKLLTFNEVVMVVKNQLLAD
ncbi:MAG: hypothetical protein V4596_03855 [Bdellovibrionota bacterium]